MKIKTSELIGSALDWSVAKCEGSVNIDASGLPWLPDESPNEYGEAVWFKPSTDWAQGGPIIEANFIDIQCFNSECWASSMPPHFGHVYKGITPLIAAMRCYVASKMGDEIEIPENLE